MSARVVCPTCHTALDAPEDLLGQAVKCQECNSTFTARTPARPRSEPARAEKPRDRRRNDDEDEDDRPRSSRRTSRRDDDDYDDRPRRRVKKKAGSSALPFILVGGGLVLFVLLAAGAGVYFLVARVSAAKVAGPGVPPAANDPGGFGPLPPAAPLPVNPPPVAPDPGNKQPADAGQKVTLSNPRWSRGGFGGNFEVDYEFARGQRPAGPNLTLRWKYADGTGGSATIFIPPFAEDKGTWRIQVPGAFGGMGRGGRGGMEIWVEEGAFGPAGTKVSNTVTLN